MGVELKVKILVYNEENKNSDKLCKKPKCQDKQVEIKITYTEQAEDKKVSERDRAMQVGVQVNE